MKLNNEEVNLNDRLFDISIHRGYGYVASITKSYIEVKYEKYSVRYDSSGTQIGKDWQTLFWDKPLIIQPRKDEAAWYAKRELINNFYNLVAKYKEFL